MISRADLIDVPERRAISLTQFECRTTGNTLKFEGYASVFDKPYEVHGGPTSGGWDETVSRSAFKKTLAEKPDVVLLLNHEGLPLARTRNARGGTPTLALGADSTGLHTSSDLDLRDPDVRSLAVKYDRGDLGDMSFAFRVKQNTWSDDETQRCLDEVSLHKGDVSIVTFGASPHTSSTLRSVISYLANGELDEKQLVELRAMSDQVDRAMATLRAADASEPYGAGDYADPGYLDEDGNQASKSGKKPQKRFPLFPKDRVRDALSRVEDEKVKDEYTPEQYAHVKAAIDAAAKKAGIDVGGGSDDRSTSRAFVATDGGQIFAEKAHRLALEGGANCPVDAMGESNSLRALSPTMDYAPDVQDEDKFEGGWQGEKDSLAQAVHDLVADAAHTQPFNGDAPQLSEGSPYSRNHTVASATSTACRGNLTLAEAARMMRPDDAPEPFTLADAERVAS